MLDGFRGYGLQLIILHGIVLLPHDPLSQGHQHLQRVHLVRVQHLLRGVGYVGDPDKAHLVGSGNFFTLDLDSLTQYLY